MDTRTLLIAFVAAMGLPSAITGFCFWLLEMKIKKRDEEAKEAAKKKEQEEAEKDRKRREYEQCQLNMTVSCMALAEATAKAVQRIPEAHCNGDMDGALHYAEKIKNEQREFLRKQAIDSLDF